MLRTEPLIGPIELADFAQKCEEQLLHSNKVEVLYPRGTSLTNWNPDEIKALNSQLLDGLRNAGNVYALFVNDPNNGSSWTVHYVGERKSIGLRQRLTEHLIKKNHQTGSMLKNVQEAVAQGNRISVAYIKVEPEALRLFVEESIISKNMTDLPWNTHG
jgi:hypothetical protein